MMLRRWVAVWSARNREFLRDRAAFSWNVIFPVFIVIALAAAFSGGPRDMFKVGIYGAAGSAAQLPTLEYIHYIEITDLPHAVTKVERHQLDMLFDRATGRYWINDGSPAGYMLEQIFKPASLGFARQQVSGQQVRYVDWVIPGVLAMNMMWSALYGVGYVIVRYRKNGVLKRLKATPLTAFEFLTAQIASRLWLLLLLTAMVYAGTDLLLGFQMFGSYLNLLLVFALGAVSMISLGLVIAARLASEELAEGLLNLISWPMMLLSGVWFSLEGVHPLVQKVALLFPLTHIVEAARAIMLDGAGLLEIAPQMAVLAGMSLFFIAIGSWLFRWE